MSRSYKVSLDIFDLLKQLITLPCLRPNRYAFPHILRLPSYLLVHLSWQSCFPASQFELRSRGSKRSVEWVVWRGEYLQLVRHHHLSQFSCKLMMQQAAIHTPQQASRSSEHNHQEQTQSETQTIQVILALALPYGSITSQSSTMQDSSVCSTLPSLPEPLMTKLTHHRMVR